MNKSIKNIAFALLWACVILPVQSQVAIGTNSLPQPGALLDVREKDETGGGWDATKGLIIPRVSLVDLNELKPMLTGSETNYATLKLSHTGMTVYNVNPTFPKGIYTWNGTAWIASNALTKYDLVSGTSSAGATVPLTVTNGTGQVVGASNATLAVNNTAPIFNANKLQNTSVTTTTPTGGQVFEYSAATGNVVWQTRGLQTRDGTPANRLITIKIPNGSHWYDTEYSVKVPIGKSTVYAGFTVRNPASGYVAFALFSSGPTGNDGQNPPASTMGSAYLITNSSAGGITANPTYTGFTTIATNFTEQNATSTGETTWYVNNTSGSEKTIYVGITVSYPGIYGSVLQIRGVNSMREPFILAAY